MAVTWNTSRVVDPTLMKLKLNQNLLSLTEATSKILAVAFFTSCLFHFSDTVRSISFFPFDTQP
jgi:hypothetical protein